MKKSLTEEWQEIKKRKESSYDDLSNPLGHFLASIPKKDREQILDHMNPERHEQACLGHIQAVLRKYRRVQYYYFRPIDPELIRFGHTEERHRSIQLRSLKDCRKSIKEQIVNLRALRIKKTIL